MYLKPYFLNRLYTCYLFSCRRLFPTTTTRRSFPPASSPSSSTSTRLCGCSRGGSCLGLGSTSFSLCRALCVIAVLQVCSTSCWYICLTLATGAFPFVSSGSSCHSHSPICWPSSKRRVLSTFKLELRKFYVSNTRTAWITYGEKGL